jgi:hypothetical protein
MTRTKLIWMPALIEGSPFSRKTRHNHHPLTRIKSHSYSLALAKHSPLLHFVLDVALDPLQIGAVIRSMWKSIGYMFWKHRHLEQHLCKLFRSSSFSLA